MKMLKNIFSPAWFHIFSQLFINLAAGWFGVVLIVPGITRFENFGDVVWLTKNLLFGILALVVAKRLDERKK